MFTGIVEEVGTVRETARHRDVLLLQVAARKVVEGLPEGGSVAVNGCCLTAIRISPDGFVCELTEETLRRTSFSGLQAGARVNLERPMPADGRFDGHIVQGHVDGVGRVSSLRLLGDSAELRIAPPAELLRYLVQKGSIAVEGVSLTVAALGADAFTVALIPYTLNATNLRDARPGDPVNLEVDVIAKYVERLLAR
jgi:riboflavin synthase